MACDKVFKFVDSAHMDSILRDGTLRIASLSYYRALERERIGDPLEGITEVTPVDHLALTNDGHTAVHEPYTPTGWPAGISHRAKGTVIAKNVTFRYQFPEVYIFCASYGDLDTLVNAMCRDVENGYSACVSIHGGIDLLAHRMFRRGIVAELDRRVYEIFDVPQVGRVTYERIVYDHREHQEIPAPTAFRKSLEFSSQAEIRIVFPPRQTLEVQQLTIKIPRPQSLLGEVFREIPHLESKERVVATRHSP